MADWKDRLRGNLQDLGAAFKDTKAKMQRGAQDLGAAAYLVVDSVRNAPTDLDEPEALRHRYAQALAAVAPQLDKEAIAVALGSLSDAGVGKKEGSGLEVLYVRPEPPLRGLIRVSRTRSRSLKLAMGSSAGGYAACYYGDRKALLQPFSRQGGDVELLVASLGAFRVRSDKGAAAGWLVSLRPGLDLGVPILSNFSGFELDESPLGGFSLSSGEAEPLEKAIQQAPDRSNRRAIAQALLKR